VAVAEDLRMTMPVGVGDDRRGQVLVSGDESFQTQWCCYAFYSTSCSGSSIGPSQDGPDLEVGPRGRNEWQGDLDRIDYHVDP